VPSEWSLHTALGRFGTGARCTAYSLLQRMPCRSPSGQAGSRACAAQPIGQVRRDDARVRLSSTRRRILASAYTTKSSSTAATHSAPYSSLPIQTCAPFRHSRFQIAAARDRPIRVGSRRPGAAFLAASHNDLAQGISTLHKRDNVSVLAQSVFSSVTTVRHRESHTASVLIQPTCAVSSSTTDDTIELHV